MLYVSFMFFFVGYLFEVFYNSSLILVMCKGINLVGCMLIFLCKILKFGLDLFYKIVGKLLKRN